MAGANRGVRLAQALGVGGGPGNPVVSNRAPLFGPSKNIPTEDYAYKPVMTLLDIVALGKQL
jgi:hypothetical protein